MYEGGGAAVLGSIQPQPLDFMPDGCLDLEKVAANIKSDNLHFARTTLLCLENTQAGKVLPLDYLVQARALADEYGLGLHLDGARVFNASVKLDVPVTEISRYFDSVSVCLSKGLCAPVGSVLCGPGEFIGRARRWRKTLGGGMRQAGVLAAAGILAITGQVQHLGKDHENARQLAQALNDFPDLELDPESVQTNIIFMRVTKSSRQSLTQKLAEEGVLVTGSHDHLRLVTHFDFKQEQIEQVAAAFSRVLQAS
jgi:threonine aldolase